MADRKGDPAKQPPECKMRETSRCKHLRETSHKFDMSGETYDCDVCGEHFRLYYDEMQ